MAFKAVWALEMKRRENDRRIIALHVEIKDMMGVLVQFVHSKATGGICSQISAFTGLKMSRMPRKLLPMALLSRGGCRNS